jgi:poly-D-alanine transfer protein DltD
LELLLRLLKELGAKPLILSMPLNGPALVNGGVSGSSLQMYAQRLRGVAAKYDVPVEAFEKHVGDPSFLNDQHDHMSERGWMFYNRALDAFFHGEDLTKLTEPPPAEPEWSKPAALASPASVEKRAEAANLEEKKPTIPPSPAPAKPLP